MPRSKTTKAKQRQSAHDRRQATPEETRGARFNPRSRNRFHNISFCSADLLRLRRDVAGEFGLGVATVPDSCGEFNDNTGCVLVDRNRRQPVPQVFQDKHGNEIAVNKDEVGPAERPSRF